MVYPIWEASLPALLFSPLSPICVRFCFLLWRYRVSSHFKPCFAQSLLVVTLAVFGLTSFAKASVEVGDFIRFQDGPGSPGGEFGIALDAVPSITQFVTFCLEKNEHINFQSRFYVESIEKYADNGGFGGGSPDYISAETAWLYYNFRQGTLAGYDFGLINDHSQSRINSANAFQNAVWYLEDEQDNAGSGQSFVDLAQAEKFAFDNDANYSGNMQTAIDLVRAMNLRWHKAGGKKAQSQLYLLGDGGGSGGDQNVIPEPATATVWMLLGASGMFLGRRNRRKRPA